MSALEALVASALEEDLGLVGDLTSELTVPADATGTAYVVAREDGVLSGTAPVEATYRLVGEASVQWRLHDGDRFAAGDTIASIDGSARSILTGERVALNFLGHLCGVATQTRTMVDLVAGSSAQIADTRKTTPGLRSLQKQAVAHGGGSNHRFGLFDAVMVKDNHIGLAGGLSQVLDALAAGVGHMVKVEVEVDSQGQLQHILAFDAARVAHGERPVVDVVLLDNMSPEQVRSCVSQVKAHPVPVVVEVSGGVGLDTVAALAAAGPDVISSGALTHSVRNIDLGLDLQTQLA